MTGPARWEALSRMRSILVAAILACTSSLAHADETREYLRERLEQLQFIDQTAAGDLAIAAPDVIYRLYQARNLELIWRDEKVAELKQLIGSAREYGFDPRDYHFDEISALPALASLDPFARVDADFLLTEALLRIGYHARFGKVDPTTFDASFNYGRGRRGADPVQSLLTILAADTLLDGLTGVVGPTPMQDRLRAMLAEYRAILSEGGEWPTVAEGPTLRVGDADSRVRILRERLAREGFEAEYANPDHFDVGLEAQVRAAQHRYSVDVDGAVGPATVRALNVPLAQRIGQLRVNLERARWLVPTLGTDFVAVNIAAFRVYLIRNEDIIWSARAQVGKPYRQTPVFRADMKYLVLNPDWTVPPGILRSDVIPALKRDPGYAARQQMEILDGEGNRVDPASIDFSNGFPYQVRQVPGPWNALGEVKFIFPNPHFIFLHDTPSKGLFERAERTFSSGCIRVERPFELAQLLLGGSEKWSREAIDAELATGKTKTVFLPKPLPVKIFYLTASALPGEDFHFLPDVYDRDQKVLAELNEPFRYVPPEGVPGFAP